MKSEGLLTAVALVLALGLYGMNSRYMRGHVPAETPTASPVEVVPSDAKAETVIPWRSEVIAECKMTQFTPDHRQALSSVVLKDSSIVTMLWFVSEDSAAADSYRARIVPRFITYASLNGRKRFWELDDDEPRLLNEKNREVVARAMTVAWCAQVEENYGFWEENYQIQQGQLPQT